MKGGMLEPSGETKCSLANIENVKHGKAKTRPNNILILGSAKLLQTDVLIFIGVIIDELLRARHPSIVQKLSKKRLQGVAGFPIDTDDLHPGSPEL
jgi:hypothetical protein